MPFLALLFSNPLRSVAVAGFLALGLFVGVLLLDRANLKTQVAQNASQITLLNVQKAALKSSVDNLNLEVDLAKTAQSALEASIVTRQAQATSDALQTKEITDAPKTDDAPVAPVLRRAISGLRRK